MVIAQKPNKRLIFTVITAVSMLLFRKNKMLSKLSQFLFVASLNQWSRAEYISGAGKFRKGLGAAGLLAARLFAVYKRKGGK